MTHNLSDGEYHDCRPHPRASVRRTSGFVLTGKPDLMQYTDSRLHVPYLGTDVHIPDRLTAIRAPLTDQSNLSD